MYLSEYIQIYMNMRVAPKLMSQVVSCFCCRKWSTNALTYACCSTRCMLFFNWFSLLLLLLLSHVAWGTCRCYFVDFTICSNRLQWFIPVTSYLFGYTRIYEIHIPTSAYLPYIIGIYHVPLNAHWNYFLVHLTYNYGLIS